MTRVELFTSESVTEGHPDKVADQISDAVLDAVLQDDPYGRVACECLVTTGLVVVAGEITTTSYVDIAQTAREKVREIGYVGTPGFDADSLSVLIEIDEQSADIAQGVDSALEHRLGSTTSLVVADELDLIGAGDQGMVFGYACEETPELMPLPIMLAHALTRRLAEVRKDSTIPYLLPDGKAQVTIRYEVDGDGRRRAVAVERLLVSTQHREGVTQHRLWQDVLEHVVLAAIPEHLYEPRRLKERDFLLVNPTGSFVVGGPQGDTGLTGRKIIVDTYGGYARHGGGAFSGKDPTKVDRSGAYAARWAAKNVVAAGLAERCEIQIAYAIGVAQPFSLRVDCFGTEREEQAQVEEWVRENFDLRPAAILRDLDLRRPIYAQTAAYGHFGKEGLPWEEEELALAAGGESG